MDLSEYQKRAAGTDVIKHAITTLLGLSGEVGSLHAVYKKKIRDNLPKEKFRKDLSEEIGDVLWYLSALATQNQLDLSDIAEKNLEKVKEFFGEAEAPFFDTAFPDGERLPHHMKIVFFLNRDGRVQMLYENNLLGDSLSNNSHIEDNYKFHDAFHLAFLTHLHWSPNIRRLLKRKRKSDKTVDENEDGARACAVEEGIAALVFAHAREQAFYPRREMVSLKLVSLLKGVSENFEVSACSTSSWRKAIYDGSRVFEVLSKNGGGTVDIDLITTTMMVE